MHMHHLVWWTVPLFWSLVFIAIAHAEPVCFALPADKQAACDLADSCLSQTRRFNETRATIESQERFIGHCILQGEIRTRRN
jgi:hypothetical protein